MSHSAYSTDEPIVSVWFGTFPDADAHREYFTVRSTPHSNGSETCQFWTDLGVEWTEPDNEECSGYIGEPVAVKKLLGDSFSYSESFREALLAACQSADIIRANLVLLLYGFAYSDREGFRSPFMKFAGAFPYSPE